MERIERYLKRVAAGLPRADRDDIVAELREELLSRVEERERAAGRSLADGEIADLLRELGHPLAVAGGFAHPGGLIPGALVPFYRMVLVWATVAIAGVHGALLVSRAVAAGSIGAAVSRSLPGMVVALLAAFTVVTIVFMALGRARGARPEPVSDPGRCCPADG